MTLSDINAPRHNSSVRVRLYELSPLTARLGKSRNFVLSLSPHSWLRSSKHPRLYPSLLLAHWFHQFDRGYRMALFCTDGNFFWQMTLGSSYTHWLWGGAPTSNPYIWLSKYSNNSLIAVWLPAWRELKSATNTDFLLETIDEVVRDIRVGGMKKKVNMQLTRLKWKEFNFQGLGTFTVQNFVQIPPS